MKPVLYSVEELEVNGAPRYAITLEDFPDTKVILGEVKLIEQELEDQAKVSYTYEVLEGPDSPELSLRLGDFIVHVLTEEFNKLPIAFTGGT